MENKEETQKKKSTMLPAVDEPTKMMWVYIVLMKVCRINTSWSEL